jgi:uncharacterized repeat protein (TIGR01451 family)
MSIQTGRRPFKALSFGPRHVGLIVVLIVVLAWLGLDASRADASPASVTVSLASSAVGTVKTGDQVTYSLSVGNTGSTASGQVTITDEFSSRGFDPNSATCGSVPNCTLQINRVAVACPAPPNLCIGGIVPIGVTWTITSVGAGSSGLTVSVNTFVDNGFGTAGPWTNQATWTGDGCLTSAGCSTNIVSHPVATVTVTQSASPPPRPVNQQAGGGTTLSIGQAVDETLTVANIGDAPSDPITVVDSIPSATGTIYLPGSASCGTVQGCTLSVTPCTTSCPPYQSPCGSSSYCPFVLPTSCGCAAAQAPGTQLTWTIPTVAPATELNLFFATTVTSASTDVAVNAARWNGPLSPAVQLPFGFPAQTSGDGCVSDPSLSPYPAFFGCAALPFAGEVTYDLAQPVPPTSSTTAGPVPTTMGSIPITAGPVTASSGSLAFTGPSRTTEWVAIVGVTLVLLGIALALMDLPRRAAYRLVHLGGRRPGRSFARSSKALGAILMDNAALVARWLLDR